MRAFYPLGSGRNPSRNGAVWRACLCLVFFGKELTSNCCSVEIYVRYFHVFTPQLLCGNRLGKKNAAIASGCDKPKIGYTRVHFHENMVIHQWMESNYGSSHHFQRCPFSKSMLPGFFPSFSLFFCAGPGHSLPQATSSSLPERRILVKFPFWGYRVGDVPSDAVAPLSEVKNYVSPGLCGNALFGSFW